MDRMSSMLWLPRFPDLLFNLFVLQYKMLLLPPGDGVDYIRFKKFHRDVERNWQLAHVHQWLVIHSNRDVWSLSDDMNRVCETCKNSNNSSTSKYLGNFIFKITEVMRETCDELSKFSARLSLFFLAVLKWLQEKNGLGGKLPVLSQLF